MASQPVTAHHVFTPFSFAASADRRIVYIFTPNPHVGPTSQTLEDFRASIAAGQRLLAEVDRVGLVPSAAAQPFFWMDDPAEFEVRDGIACCAIRTGGTTIELRSTTHTMVRGMGNATRAFGRMAKAKPAKLLRFPRRTPRVER